MKYRRRIYYSAAQRDLMWDRWRRADSMGEIGRLFDRPHTSVYQVLAPTGGIRPPPRKRSRLALSLAEREEISRGLVAGRSIRAIAATLGRAPSTISREIARNAGAKLYRAARADKRAWQSALRPKPCKLALDQRLRQIVIAKLKRRWSPQQIAGWLKREAAKIKAGPVSHETIYRSLYVQTRGVLKKELARYLRSHRQMRRSRYVKQAADRPSRIRNAVSISQRPASVADRAVPGHWEGDLLCGPGRTSIATLVERHSRYVMLAKVTSRHTEAVVNALIKQAKHLPEELYKSLTWDRGTELADHERFTMETDIAVYFCDPQSPWQRGSNENTNRLLREYLPKGSDLSRHSQAQLNKIARELNERPRKTLDYQTPAERFNECVAATR